MQKQIPGPTTTVNYCDICKDEKNEIIPYAGEELMSGNQNLGVVNGDVAYHIKCLTDKAGLKPMFI